MGFIGMGLGVAAAEGHQRFGMLPAYPADGLPGFMVAGGGDGTAVDYIYVRVSGKGRDFVAAFPQKLLHGLGFILVDFTAKRINCNSHDSPCTF